MKARNPALQTGCDSSYVTDKTDPRHPNRRIHEATKQLTLALNHLCVRSEPEARGAKADVEAALIELGHAKNYLNELDGEPANAE